MINGIRTKKIRGLNKGRGSKFCVDSRVRLTPEVGRRKYRPKRCKYNNNNKDEDNSPKTLNDNNFYFKIIIIWCRSYSKKKKIIINT